MRKSVVILIVVVAFAGVANAENKNLSQAEAVLQGTITDGDAVFDFNTLGSDNAVLVDFLANGITDQVYQAWYYWRTSGGAAELFLPWPADTEDYTANVGTFTWEDLDGTVDATLEVTLHDGVDPDAATTIWVLTVTNVSGSVQDFEFFGYVDADADGTAGSDSATLLTPNSHIQITDGTSTVEYRAFDPSDTAYQVTSFATLRGLLADGNPDNLDNTGLPFGPADFTGGFQWTLIGVPNLGSVVIESVLSINETAVPVELQSFSVR